jgi:hypothetical protein
VIRVARFSKWVLAPALVALGVALLFAVFRHAAAGGPPTDLSFRESWLLLFGVLLMAEGILEATGHGVPALVRVAASEGRTGTILALTISAAIMTVLAYNFRSYLVDDSFITFRYAKHVARGLGPVWNPGERPVEGYSNFLWLLLSTLAVHFRLDPLDVARFVGACCYFVSLVAAYFLARDLARSSVSARLAALCFAATPAFAFWAMSGLESISVVLFALLYLRAFVREFHAPHLPWRTATWATALILSRPETPLYLLLSIVPVALSREVRRFSWLAKLIVLVAPVMTTYLLWKWWVFGTPIPNTITAKAHLLAGPGLTGIFVAYAFPLLGVGLLRVLSGATRLAERQVLWIVGGSLFAAMNVATQVAHYFRFFLPAFALLIALIGLWCADWWRRALDRSLRHGWLAAALAILLFYVWIPLPDMKAYADGEASGLHRAHEAIGRYLRQRYREDDVLAASDCGIVPYLCEMKTIDVWGLTDPFIARHGFSSSYVMKRRPEAVVLHSLSGDHFVARARYDQELFGVVSRGSSYEVAGRWEFFGYWLWLFTKRSAGDTSTRVAPVIGDS